MYNNPFMYQSLYKPSLFSRMFGGLGSARTLTNGINWGNILNTAQKSLGIINQTIPLINQVRPMISNAKTMFKIAGAIRGNNVSQNKNTTINNNSTVKQSIANDNKPIFYI